MRLTGEQILEARAAVETMVREASYSKMDEEADVLVAALDSYERSVALIREWLKTGDVALLERANELMDALGYPAS